MTVRCAFWRVADFRVFRVSPNCLGGSRIKTRNLENPSEKFGLRKMRALLEARIYLIPKVSVYESEHHPKYHKLPNYERHSRVMNTYGWKPPHLGVEDPTGPPTETLAVWLCLSVFAMVRILGLLIWALVRSAVIALLGFE